MALQCELPVAPVVHLLAAMLGFARQFWRNFKACILNGSLFWYFSSVLR